MAEEPFPVRMQRVLRKRLRRTLEAGSTALGRGRSDELHALRLCVKRLRYNLEFAATLAGDHSDEPLRLLALLQGRLGDLADLDTFDRFYCELLDGLAEDDERRVGLLARRVEVRRERENLLGAARALWSGAGGEPYRDKLAASMSAALGSLSPNDDS
jgi:CHAD domain-containing protein